MYSPLLNNFKRINIKFTVMFSNANQSFMNNIQSDFIPFETTQILKISLRWIINIDMNVLAFFKVCVKTL
jgi:hypothetical protein